MKVYISVDMEGSSGVATQSDHLPGGDGYERARKLLTGEVNAAVEGALAAGAREIVVCDSHGPSMRNILLEELNPAADLVRGPTRLIPTIAGLDESFDAAFLVGQHAQIGTPHAVWDHTMWSIIYQLTLNGQPMGEVSLKVILAGHFGVPVVLVTGDQHATAEARGLLGDVETVVVKRSLAREVARCLPPARAQRLIKEGAERALQTQGERKPYVLSGPYHLVVDFALTGHADGAETIPGTRRTGGRRIEYTHDDLITLMKAFTTMQFMAYSFGQGH